MSSGAFWVSAGFGLAAGIAVTAHSHRSPSSPGWAKRLPGTRLRWADLPVGGCVAIGAAGLLRLAGRRAPATVAAGLALGAAVGAVGTGLVEPLPA
jgi:hypothetical protein